MAAGRRSDGMALFAPLCHFAGLIGSHEATVFTAVEDGHGANNWLLQRIPVILKHSLRERNSWRIRLGLVVG